MTWHVQSIIYGMKASKPVLKQKEHANPYKLALLFKTLLVQ
nr:MAG TPA: hypothetical protein [Caudoviricetes sp.]